MDIGMMKHQSQVAQRVDLEEEKDSNPFVKFSSNQFTSGTCPFLNDIDDLLSLNLPFSSKQHLVIYR